MLYIIGLIVFVMFINFLITKFVPASEIKSCNCCCGCCSCHCHDDY